MTNKVLSLQEKIAYLPGVGVDIPDGTCLLFAGGEYMILYKNSLVPLYDILQWVGLEEYLSTLPQQETPVIHHFYGGVYTREMRIPAGTFIIGKRHRHRTCNILMSGKLTVYLGDGADPQTVEGPLIFESAPLVKKVAYAHTDVIFMNMHPTSLTDEDEIEREFIITDSEYLALLASSAAPVVGGKETLCLGEL